MPRSSSAATLDAQGKSRAWINGRPATLAQLTELGEMLVDLHGQHAHQSLLAADAQRELLDAFGGFAVLAREVGAAWRAWRDAADKSEAAAEGRAGVRRRARPARSAPARARRAQRHRRRVGDADAGAVAPRARGLAARSGQRRRGGARRRATRRWCAALTAIVARLVRGRRARPGAGRGRRAARARAHPAGRGRARIARLPGAARPRSRRARARRGAARRDPRRRPPLPRARRGAARTARGDRGAACRHRRIGRRRRAGEARGRMPRQSLRALADRAVEEAPVRGAASSATASPRRCRSSRWPAAASRSRCRRSPRPRATASEQVEFRVASHPKQPLGPLARVASGGELSRVALAIQVVTSEVGAVPTLVFDEVDAGIGGAVAATVGRLMQSLGARRQVLCVTHLPQVAAFADAQLPRHQEAATPTRARAASRRCRPRRGSRSSRACWPAARSRRRRARTRRSCWTRGSGRPDVRTLTPALSRARERVPRQRRVRARGSGLGVRVRGGARAPRLVRQIAV